MEKYIQISKSAHGTIDIILGGLNDNEPIRNWFSMLDIWGSRGYDRYHTNTIYFEIPAVFEHVIEAAPFVKFNHIDIRYI